MIFKMAVQRWQPFENMALFLNDLKGNNFGRTICPLSFVVIVLILSEETKKGRSELVKYHLINYGISPSE